MQSLPDKHRYWVIDFDRCLGNVDVLFEHYLDVLCDHHRIDAESIVTARRKVEASKGSFDVVSYLISNGLLTDNELQLVGEGFIRRSAGDARVLMPGAQEFLRYLKLCFEGRYGVVTFGNPYWQQLKISAAGLGGMPHMVVNSPQKASYIATWYDNQAERYILPKSLLNSHSGAHQTIKEVVLVDDKPKAFDGLHAMTSGYLVTQRTEDSDIPMSIGRVKWVENLTAIIDSEGVR